MENKTRQIVALLLGFMLAVTSLPPLTAKAASNPYPWWNYNNGVNDRERSCTSVAWQKTYDTLKIALPAWGNGGSWYNNAKKAGYSVGSSPKVNSLVVWTGGTYGHVAYVTEVYSGKNNFKIYEGGNKGGSGYKDGVGSRKITNGKAASWQTLVGFIYLTSSDPQPSAIKGNDVVVANGNYRIASALNDNKYLDLINNNTKNGTEFQLYDNDGTDAQLFTLWHNKRLGYYTFQHAKSGKYMDVEAAFLSRPYINDKRGSGYTPYQDWVLEDAGNGYYYIRARKSGFYLDVKDGLTANGTEIRIILGNKSAAQKWKFIPETKEEVKQEEVQATESIVDVPTAENITEEPETPTIVLPTADEQKEDVEPTEQTEQIEPNTVDTTEMIPADMDDPVVPDQDEMTTADEDEPIVEYEDSNGLSVLNFLDEVIKMRVGDNMALDVETDSPDYLNDDFIWESSDESVASVSESGVVTAVAAGKAAITVTSPDGELSDECVVTVLLSAPTISRLKANKASITVAWKSDGQGATGYQIIYGTSKKLKTFRSTTSLTGTNSKTIGSLKSGKRYYVKMRTYQTVNGERIFSAWSKTKSIKTKRGGR